MVFVRGVLMCLIGSNVFIYGAENRSMVPFTGRVLADPQGMCPALYIDRALVSVGHTKKVSSGKRSMPLTAQQFIENAAQQEIAHVENKVTYMSDRINSRYVGEGDQWSLFNKIKLESGLSGYFYYNHMNAVADLIDIHAQFKTEDWNQQIVSVLAQRNSRVYGLLQRLAKEKIIKFQLMNRHMVLRAQISGSTIDDFFNNERLFPGLPAPIERYVQCLVENYYRRAYMCDSNRDDIMFHVLLTAFRNSRHDETELRALLQSQSFRKYEEETQFAFTRYINERELKTTLWCEWFPWNCEK